MAVSTEQKMQRQELVTQWRASGLSQRAFALKHGVSQKQISYWLLRLERTYSTYFCNKAVEDQKTCGRLQAPVA